LLGLYVDLYGNNISLQLSMRAQGNLSRQTRIASRAIATVMNTAEDARSLLPSYLF